MAQTLLTLSPEFGGARFGPFGAGTISIGSDSSRCQVVLHPSTGALPVHAMLTDTGAGWQLQPSQVGAMIFVRTGGRVSQLQGYATLQAGDALVIGTQNGPALIVSHMAEQAPRAGGGIRGPSIPGASNLTGNAFSREIWRQLESTLVTLPYGRDIYRFVHRFRTGSLFRPRNLIAAGVGLFAFFGFGCVSCFGTVGTALFAMFS